tara:strand:+ start:99 stop:641 length:543 start_codon:yes stop_codon:yes gene_type:complete
MNLFYLHEEPEVSAKLHCDKHVVKMIIEYAQMLSTAHRMLDGEQYTDSSSGRKIQRWEHSNSNMDKMLYKASHINHPSTRWVRENAIQYQYAYDMFTALCDEYTYRYKRVHLTDKKLRVILDEIPRNCPIGEWSEPPQCMPEDVKVPGDSISAYHKYYRNYKRSFSVWTERPIPEFMYAN